MTRSSFIHQTFCRGRRCVISLTSETNFHPRLTAGGLIGLEDESNAATNARAVFVSLISKFAVMLDVAILSSFHFLLADIITKSDRNCPLRTHPPSRLSAVSEDLPRSRVGFHGSLVRPSASGRVARFWLRSAVRRRGRRRYANFSPVADVLCPSAHVKDQTAFRRRPAGHKPARRKSTLWIIPRQTLAAQ